MTKTPEKTALRVIALCGPKYSGKDTAFKGLMRHNQTYHKNLFRRAPMAEGVKNIVTEVFGWGPELYEHPTLKEQKLDVWPFIEPRWPLMDIANWMRDKYGGDVWPRRWERVALQCEGWGAHVITDCRFPEEVEMLDRHNSLLVYVKRDESERALEEAQKAGDQMALNQSESHYDMLKREADVIVENNGAIHNLYNDIDAVVNNYFGFWDHWPNVEQDLLHKMRTGAL